MGTMMQSSLAKNMKAAIPAGSLDLSKLDPAVAEQVAGLANSDMLLNRPKMEGIIHTLPTDIQPMVNQMIEAVRDALSSALSTVFLSGAVLLVVALILTFFLREIPLRTSNKMPPQEMKQEAGSGELNPVSKSI